MVIKDKFLVGAGVGFIFLACVGIEICLRLGA